MAEPEAAATPLDQVEKAWHMALNVINSGGSPDPRALDRTAQFAQIEASLSIARSLEKIAAAVDDGNLNFWVERFTGSIEAAIHNGIRGGVN